MNQNSKSWLVGFGGGILLGIMMGMATIIRFYGIR